jgi:hypothetical protein
MEKELIYTTLKGGKVKKINGRFIFTTQPNTIDIKAGDEVPEDMELLPDDQATLAAMEKAVPDNKPLSDDDIVFK